jgi:hypothetical protein
LNFGSREADVPRVIAALQTCTQMKRLVLSGFQLCFTSEQLAICLAPMLQLEILALDDCETLTSLSFLAAGNLHHTLKTLNIGDCESSIPVGEIHMIHALHSLRKLFLSRETFDESLSVADQQPYNPPSQIFPLLTEFFYQA